MIESVNVICTTRELISCWAVRQLLLHRILGELNVMSLLTSGSSGHIWWQCNIIITIRHRVVRRGQKTEDTIVEKLVDIHWPEKVPVVKIWVVDTDGSFEVWQFRSQPSDILNFKKGEKKRQKKCVVKCHFHSFNNHMEMCLYILPELLTNRFHPKINRPVPWPISNYIRGVFLDLHNNLPEMINFIVKRFGLHKVELLKCLSNKIP